MHYANREELERNIRTFKGLQVIVEPLFWGPVIVTYILSVGHMTLRQFYFMEAVLMLLAAFAQVFTGVLADRIGRKKTILLGTFGMLAGTVVLAQVGSPVGVWFSDLLITLGFSCYSGSEQGILRGSIDKLGLENGLRREVLKANGQANSRRYLVVAFCSLATGHLYAHDPRLPIILSLPPMLLACYLASRLVEPGPKSEPGAKPSEKQNNEDFRRIMRAAFAEIFRSSTLLWLLALAVLLEVSSKIWFFSYNPYFELVDIPVIWFGYIFAGLNLVAWFVSRSAHSIEESLGEGRSVWLLIGAVGLPMVLMGIFVHPWAAVLVLSQNVYRGLARPLYAAIQSHHSSEKFTATIDSVRSGLVGLGAFCGHLLFRSMLGRYTLPQSLEIIGVVVLAAGAGLMFWYGRIQRKED